VKPTAEQNRQWVRDRIRREGLTGETELRALAVAEFRRELEAPGTEQAWLS